MLCSFCFLGRFRVFGFVAFSVEGCDVPERLFVVLSFKCSSISYNGWFKQCRARAVATIFLLLYIVVWPFLRVVTRCLWMFRDSVVAKCCKTFSSAMPGTAMQ